jgi:phage terminase large subunit GpA-like protein
MSTLPRYADARDLVNTCLAKAFAPRVSLTVSQWADAERMLSGKGSAEPGQWRTSRNPPLREPMDCLSARSPVREVVLMFPIQFGKTEVALNALGYTMDHAPGPIMVALPGEVSMNKWIAQKLAPMLETTEAVRRTLTTTASRDGANRRDFKDFAGGQLYLEHAGSPSRLKSTSVGFLVVDELDEFAANLTSGDDPLELLEGRTSAFPYSKRLYISTPGLQGISRIEYKWSRSDQRRYHVPCPHCGHMQHLEWSGLQWSANGHHVWYVCAECGAAIDERHKGEMIEVGDWVPDHPGAPVRGYTINGLYYQPGLGPRWRDLADKWREAQGDIHRLKTFINDRLAEPWEDPTMRSVKYNVIADRAEPYPLRTAPEGVLAVTAGVDTQDNRLAVQIVGWGRRMAQPDVWVALTDLINRPIQAANGAALQVQATAIDAGGHRTEDVYHFVRQRRIRRPMAIFGAKANTAPVLSKPRFIDVTYRGKTDRRALAIHHVGTVGIKHHLYGKISSDADREPGDRWAHFSDQLETEYFSGLVSETYNPTKNRFEKRSGARNEALDTWVYAYAAAHHSELRLHRFTLADWERLSGRLATTDQNETREVAGHEQQSTDKPAKKRRRGGYVGGWK